MGGGGSNGPSAGVSASLCLLRVSKWCLEIAVALFGDPKSVPRRVFQFRRRVMRRDMQVVEVAGAVVGGAGGRVGKNSQRTVNENKSQ